jgi:hypothetical protein
MPVSLDESGNWNASGKQGAEFGNNFDFASLDSIVSLSVFYGKAVDGEFPCIPTIDLVGLLSSVGKQTKQT